MLQLILWCNLGLHKNACGQWFHSRAPYFIFFPFSNQKKMLQMPKTGRMFHSKVGCSSLQWQGVKFGWLWVVVFNIWLIVWWEELVSVLEESSHPALAGFTCHGWLFSLLSFWLQKLVCLRTKTWKSQFIRLPDFERFSSWLCISELAWMRSCAYFDWVRPHILLVFQNITSLNIACLY